MVKVSLPPLAVSAPQLGSRTSSGRACWPRAARHSQGGPRPVGPHPQPQVLELATSKFAHFTAPYCLTIQAAEKAAERALEYKADKAEADEEANEPGCASCGQNEAGVKNCCSTGGSWEGVCVDDSTVVQFTAGGARASTVRTWARGFNVCTPGWAERKAAKAAKRAPAAAVTHSKAALEGFCANGISTRLAAEYAKSTGGGAFACCPKTCGACGGGAAWSKCWAPLGSERPPSRLLHLPRARLAAWGSSALPE